MPALITATANGTHATKLDLQAQYQALIFGLYTYYEPDDEFKMTSGDYTRDELITEVQSFVTACQNTKASYQQWRANVQTERAMEANASEIRTGVKGITQARFGAQGAQNLQFGFSLPKPRTKSAETKAAAVVKGLATRKKRNTLGSVQKKDIKSNVSVALVVTGEDSGLVGGASSTAPAAVASAPAVQQVASAPVTAVSGPVAAAAPAVNGATAAPPTVNGATAATTPSVTNGH
jgi:hypothetical protein